MKHATTKTPAEQLRSLALRLSYILPGDSWEKGEARRVATAPMFAGEMRTELREIRASLLIDDDERVGDAEEMALKVLEQNAGILEN